MHDHVGHGVAVALQQLDMFAYYRDTAGNAARAEQKLAAVRSALEESLCQIRHLIANLGHRARPIVLESAVSEYLTDTVPESVKTHFTFVGASDRLDDAVAEEIYLIVREAVHNAVRHAAPRTLSVHVAVAEKAVSATVTDDGRGFAVDALGAADRFGLRSMAERARAIGGRLTVRSVPGHGTTVTVHAHTPGPRP
ncbi:sensor histidine kinase [Streptomyces sp. MI02-7b]|uniref:sensor histidine kinase n=1 Tax=Streptomyces sp. MI02-7b TaxID=462941 RepID=UPI0029A13B3A|nr:ATP-binding protein [Streptomyces sp. MI02-7b]MDX3078388.1 ATP-binding protein [Streptomyces sp. MI02-7b]